MGLSFAVAVGLHGVGDYGYGFLLFLWVMCYVGGVD